MIRSCKSFLLYSYVKVISSSEMLLNIYILTIEVKESILLHCEDRRIFDGSLLPLAKSWANCYVI